MTARVLASVLCLLVASCATGPPAASGMCRQADVAAAGTRLGLEQAALVIGAHDNYFDPACTVVPAGSDLTLVVTNKGRYPHDLTLPDGESVRIDGGQTAFLELRTGTDAIRFTCTIHAGMDGELRVSR